jgi:cytidyltransferase-like protein
MSGLSNGLGGASHHHEWGCVHGRFQPFHRGHLEYALRAKERCRRLAIGITNPDPSWSRVEQTSPHRHEALSNPFTYLERALMVRDSLLSAGLVEREFVVVPFPIQEPGFIRHYAPPGAVHFVRAFSAWEREKVRRLRAHGFAAELLDPGRIKEISGTEVREALRSRACWEHLLPEASAEVVRRALADDAERFGLERSDLRRALRSPGGPLGRRIER